MPSGHRPDGGGGPGPQQHRGYPICLGSKLQPTAWGKSGIIQFPHHRA